jgi:hypothetical protein
VAEADAEGDAVAEEGAVPEFEAVGVGVAVGVVVVGVVAGVVVVGVVDGDAL